MKNNKYILGTDAFDDKVFSVCLFDAENNTIVISESIVGEKGFEKRVEELTKYYNYYVVINCINFIHFYLFLN